MDNKNIQVTTMPGKKAAIEYTTSSPEEYANIRSMVNDKTIEYIEESMGGEIPKGTVIRFCIPNRFVADSLSKNIVSYDGYKIDLDKIAACGYDCILCMSNSEKYLSLGLNCAISVSDTDDLKVFINLKDGGFKMFNIEYLKESDAVDFIKTEEVQLIVEKDMSGIINDRIFRAIYDEIGFLHNPEITMYIPNKFKNDDPEKEQMLNNISIDKVYAEGYEYVMAIESLNLFMNGYKINQIKLSDKNYIQISIYLPKEKKRFCISIYSAEY